jgi:hypothetical protein
VCALGVGARGALLLGVVTALLVPEAMLRLGRTRAASCLELTRSVRGELLPDCGDLVGDFALPARVPWTKRDATLAAEELEARRAIDAYVDAAVGAPEQAALAAHAAWVDRAHDRVAEGSGRLWLEELGPRVASPSLGELAASLGDRPRLLERSERFDAWPVRVAVLDAAMLEADFNHVDEIARRYAEWDPRDADLRTHVGASLCLGTPTLGLELLERVPSDRAAKRSANIARDYGEVWAVTLACAARAGVVAPEPPASGSAGIADRPEIWLTTALRTTKDPSRRARHLNEAIERLERDDEHGVSPWLDGARASLLAAVLHASGDEVDDARLAGFARTRVERGEPSLGPSSLWLGELLHDPPGLEPSVPVAWLEAAAHRLALAAARQAAEPAGRALRDAASGMRTRAARERARRGEADRALANLDRATELAPFDAARRRLWAASLAYAAGARESALGILDADLAAEGTAPSDDADTAMRTRARSLALEALLRASLGERVRATQLAALLPELARSIDDAEISLEIATVALAFAPESLRDEAPDAPPWLGLADPHRRWARAAGDRPRDLLASYARALGAASPERRAFRYLSIERRGDAPRFALPWVVVLGGLLDVDAKSEAVETWLDAAMAIDRRRSSLRAYAFSREEAARMRGDAGAAERWSERLGLLRRLAGSDDALEIAGFLGL